MTMRLTHSASAAPVSLELPRPWPQALGGRRPAQGQPCVHAACVSPRRSPMIPVTSLLTAMERHDSAALTALLDHEGMLDEHFTYDDALALWDAGWHAWLGGDREGQTACPAWDAKGATRLEPRVFDPDAGGAQRRRESPQLWPIALGLFLGVLHPPFPALPGAPAWVVLPDVEEE